jgi:hypothetical protein
MRKLLLLAFILVLSGCFRKENNTSLSNIYVIDIDLSSKREIGLDFFQYHSYIVLETIDASLIQQINKLEFIDDKIFILDSRQAVLFIFNNEGKYISKISKRGGGPGEYISLSDFFIDLSNGIYLYDGMQGVVMQYDFQGSYIDKVEVGKGYSFTKLPDNNWLFYMGNGSAMVGEDNFYNILLYNEKFELLKRSLPFNRHLQGLRNTFGEVKNVISEYDNSIYILPLLSNYIYTYIKEEKQIEPVYEINFLGKRNRGVELRMSQSEIENYRKEINAGSIPSYINNFYKIDNTIFFGFLYENRRWLCLHQKNEQVSILLDFTFDENGLFFNPVNYFSNNKDGKILSIIDGEKFNICKNLDRNNNPIINEINKAINDEEDANPILVFYTLR